ncbi:hypothetical protein AOA81_04860 [Methanomassiliicoccales archaeon RumEn M2]|jgi:hypothetical protein|nr:hypothetical protein AOA81_04860 [Methanomassiliicoccales archaeon RumEn M2]
MASKQISFFKTLEDTNLLDKIRYSAGQYAASYIKGESEFKLDVDEDPDDAASVKIKDKNFSWDISVDGLMLTRKIKIESPSMLFGNDGIADADSILGLAVICTSSVSDRLETFNICSFGADETSIEYVGKVNLSAGKYRGNAILKTVLYLVENRGKNSGFPKQSGTILGELDRVNIILFDNDTLFPVYEVQSEEPSPWWAICEWTNIEEDPFTSEFVAIVINKSSKIYPQISLKENSSDFNPGYLAEIMSSAIQTIIEKIKESTTQWNRIMSDVTFANGTIAHMVQYMRTTLEWDFSSPNLMAKSIRSYVYSRVVPQ